MTLQQLKYFIEIVKSGTINNAAERLYIAQPSLSKALRGLESEMGVDLITRTPKGISLTSDGAEFLGYARQVIEQASLLETRWKFSILILTLQMSGSSNDFWPG